MGRRAREKRKTVKAKLLKLPAWRRKENEFGELTLRMTKAEARRRLLAKATFFMKAEDDVMREIQKRAYDDVVAQADAEFLGQIEDAIAPLGAP